MRRDSFFLALLAVLCAALVAHTSPAPPRRPHTPPVIPPPPHHYPAPQQPRPPVQHYPAPPHHYPAPQQPRPPVQHYPAPQQPRPPVQHYPAPQPGGHYPVPRPPVQHYPAPVPGQHYPAPQPGGHYPAPRPPAQHYPVPAPQPGQHYPVPPGHQVPGRVPVPPMGHAPYPPQQSTPAGSSTTMAELDQLSKCPTYLTCEQCGAAGQVRQVKVGSGSKKVTKKVRCGWSQADSDLRGRCVTFESTQSVPATVLFDSRQCPALYERVATYQRRQTATRVWSGMQSHVFYGNPDGSGKPEAGRHLASQWAARFPHDVISWDAQTHIGKSGKGKTLWRDTNYPGGVYTLQHIQAMCFDAIIASIKDHEGQRTPSSQHSHSSAGDRPVGPMDGRHGYSVYSPATRNNVCLEVFSTYSCFPSTIKPTNKRAGAKCSEDGRMLP